MKSGGLARAIELVGWLATACAGVLVLTQAIGWNGSRLVATIYALTPYLLLVTVPTAALATWQKRHALALTTGLVGVGALVLAAPLAFGSSQPPPAPGATEVTVAAVNLLFSNPVIDEAADELARQDADVILFSEYTGAHQSNLLAHPVADAYPHKIEESRRFAGGIAVWSKYPVTKNPPPRTFNYTIDATVVGPDGPIRLFGVHPPTPIFSFDGWIADLATFGQDASRATEPTLIIGDFNASYWHPPFRDLLGRGFTAAHAADRQGFSTSWPTDEVFPAFVRLDHALTGNGLVSTGVDDFTLPGSDHRGFVVSVAPAR